MTTDVATSDHKVSVEAMKAELDLFLAQAMSAAAPAIAHDRAWNRAQNGSTCQTAKRYFGSAKGAFRHFLAREQYAMRSTLFFVRRRTWYMIGILMLLHILLWNLVIQDVGATYLDVAESLALRLFQTASPGDDVQVFSFDNATAFRVTSTFDILCPFGHSELAGSFGTSESFKSRCFIFRDENCDSDPWYTESLHAVLRYMSTLHRIHMSVGHFDHFEEPGDVKFQKFASHGALFGTLDTRTFQLDNQSATHGSTLEHFAASSGMPAGSSHQENWITRLVYRFSIQFIGAFISGCVSFLIILYLKRGSSSHESSELSSAWMDSSIKAPHRFELDQSTTVEEEMPDDALSPNNELMESLLRDQMKIALEPLVMNMTAALLQQGREERKQRQMTIAMEEQKLALQKEKVQWLKHAPAPDQLQLNTLIKQQNCES